MYKKISLQQNQLKSKGVEMIRDSPAEQALMYQHMMEGLSQ